MAEDIIKFKGTNEKLVNKVEVDSFSPKTTVVVPETHNAIVFQDEQMLQTLAPGKYNLFKLIDIKQNDEISVQIMFISKTAKLKILWGTPSKFTVLNETQTCEVGLSGDFEVQVGDPRKCFLYLVGAESSLTADTLQERLMSKVVSTLEEVFIQFVKTNKISCQEFYLYKKEISDLVAKKLSKILYNDYGISVYSFNIANIIISQLQDLNNKARIFCKNCGQELDADVKFCFSCGTRVGETKQCPNCHAGNVITARFCSMCGKSLDS